MQKASYVQVLQNIASQFRFKTIQNHYFYIFWKCTKNAQRHNKKNKTRACYEISTIKLVLKSCQNFAKNYFINFMFLKIDKKTQVSLSQNNFLVIEIHLTQLYTLLYTRMYKSDKHRCVCSPRVTGSVCMRRFRLFVGQCVSVSILLNISLNKIILNVQSHGPDYENQKYCNILLKSPSSRRKAKYSTISHQALKINC